MKTNEIKLFVGNVPKDATLEELRDLFTINVAGGAAIIPHRIFIAKTDKGEPKGYAFITVWQENVVEFLAKDGIKYKDRPLAVNHAISKEDRKDHVKFFMRNISFGATKDDVRKFLGDNGVIPVNLVLVFKEGKFKGFGFALINKKDEAALMKLNGTKFMGRPFHVVPYKAEEKNEKS